jgi:ABC-type Fe3+/spermidine/putrescine transport system ATPase subunit
MMLEMKGVSFSYGKGAVAVRDLDLSIPKGEIFSLLGSSGSGKTTLLNLIAGFIKPSRGSIRIDGMDVSRIPPEKRQVGMVFQDHALFPHLDVKGNILYGVKGREKMRVLEEMVALVGLEGKERRRISDLSGGERQRIALARTLAYEPKLILLDEPLSSLDASLRVKLRKELGEILRETGATAIHVTHDQQEAISISDQMGIIHNGAILEKGSPVKLFERPERVETARFMGIENIFRIDSNGNSISIPIGKIPWKGRIPDRIGIRSSRLRLEGPGIRFTAELLEKEFRGDSIHVVAEVSGTVIEVLLPPDSIIGREMGLYFDPRDLISLEID